MSNNCKYQKLRKYISYDMGATWNAIEPAEYQKGELIEYQSKDCSIIPPKPFIYRWVDTSGYICSGHDKYNRQKKQYSDDSGLSWQDVSPEQYRMGSTLIEANSEDCGYVPPTNFKFKATYNNSTTYSAECNSSSTLTSGETNPSGYEYSAMTDAIIGDCVNNVWMWTFWKFSALTSVTIPDSVRLIGSYAFGDCTGLTSIDIPDSVLEIGDSSFLGCSGLTSVIIPNSVTTIGLDAFSGCTNISNCIIGSDVTEIGQGAFEFCTNITNITIPSSVTSIGWNAFGMCTSLTSATINATTPPTLRGTEIFGGCYNLTTIYVPAGSVNTYKSASGWSRYADKIQAIP